MLTFSTGYTRVLAKRKFFLFICPKLLPAFTTAGNNGMLDFQIRFVFYPGASPRNETKCFLDASSPHTIK